MMMSISLFTSAWKAKSSFFAGAALLRDMRRARASVET